MWESNIGYQMEFCLNLGTMHCVILMILYLGVSNNI